MLHLTPADHREQPWANGSGTTMELLRRTAPDGTLLLRLSMATVAQGGPFSVFPGIARVLTVIDGPGFALHGNGLHLEARPLLPVAFSGDLAVKATDVFAPSVDFNVMTAVRLPRPILQVTEGDTACAAHGTLAVFALDGVAVNGVALGPHDLILTDGPVRITGPGRALVLRLAYGLPV